MICHILFVLSSFHGHVTEVFITVGEDCQIGNKMFLSPPVLCPVVICREFEVVGSCSSEITLSCLLSAISHETENFCSGCFISPSAHPLPISWGWCLATPSAIQIPSSRKQHEKVCDANAIYWCAFHFALTFETVDFFLQIVCTQSHWNALFSRGRSSQLLERYPCTLMGTREKSMLGRGFGGLGGGFLAVSTQGLLSIS